MIELLRILENLFPPDSDSLARDLIIELSRYPLTFAKLSLNQLPQLAQYPDKSLFRLTFCQHGLNEHFWLILIKNNDLSHVFALSNQCYNVLHNKLSLQPNIPIEVFLLNKEGFTHPHFLYQELTNQFDPDQPLIFDRIELHHAIAGIPLHHSQPQHPLLQFRPAA